MVFSHLAEIAGCLEANETAECIKDIETRIIDPLFNATFYVKNALEHCFGVGGTDT
jgi:hypothetical protein